MLMRAHRAGDVPAVDTSTARFSPAALDPAGLLTLGAALYIGEMLPGVSLHHARTDEGVRVWAQARDGSAATGVAHEAIAYGPRDLWHEIADAHRDYVHQGSPGAEEFGLTVADGRHHVWLDDPRNVIGVTAQPPRTGR